MYTCRTSLSANASQLYVANDEPIPSHITLFSSIFCLVDWCNKHSNTVLRENVVIHEDIIPINRFPGPRHDINHGIRYRHLFVNEPPGERMDICKSHCSSLTQSERLASGWNKLWLNAIHGNEAMKFLIVLNRMDTCRYFIHSMHLSSVRQQPWTQAFAGLTKHNSRNFCGEFSQPRRIIWLCYGTGWRIQTPIASVLHRAMRSVRATLLNAGLWLDGYDYMGQK